MTRHSEKQGVLDFVAEDARHDWTFRTALTREHVHCYHDYPARMIPQIAARLIHEFGEDAHTLFDPYCGSGTSLVEAVVHGIDAIGTDLNPLARLIAEAKTRRPNLKSVDTAISRVREQLASQPKGPMLDSVDGITNLEFWFKPEVICKLSWLSDFIDELRSTDIKKFFKVAFSETARESSNTRSSEFKLYRYPAEKLASFNPDVYGIFLQKLDRNRKGLAAFLQLLERAESDAKAVVHDFNTVNEIPASLIPSQSVDLVVTSPPYGDSRTTVAYGQYSRLSAAWLKLPEAHNIDQRLMGGATNGSLQHFPCSSLNEAVGCIADEDEKRAREVVAFYDDLLRSMSNVARTLRSGGHACYVVGNRKVKGVVLPTSDVIRDFFSENGMEHVETFVRSIPNKRMPSRNSPTNKPGKLDDTMTAEYIVVMRKPT